ncbi:MAG: ATP-binding protein [Chloroflexota bacterium]
MNIEVGLGTRLNILVITINLIILAVVAYLANATSANVLRIDALTRFTDKSEEALFKVDSELVITETFLLELADEVSLLASLDTETIVTTLVTTYNRSMTVDLVYTINVQRADGTIIEIHPDDTNEQMADVQVIRDVTINASIASSNIETLDTPIWYMAELTPSTDVTQSAIRIAHPYTHESGDGVVWIDILMEDFRDLLITSLNLVGVLGDTRNGYILVLDAGGNLIDAENIDLEAFNLQRTTDILIGRINTAELSSDGLYELSEDPYNDNRPAFVNINSFEANGWGFISVFPEAEIPELPVSIFLPITLVGTIGVLVIVVVVNLFVNSAMVRPLIDLGRSAAEMGDGNLRFIVFHQDKQNEIGRLARAMDQMRSRLRESYDELAAFSEKLESRVVQRTEQLRDARQQAEQTTQQLQAVYDESLSVVNEAQLQPVLDTFIDRILDLLDASYCAVWLLTDDKQFVELVATNDTRRRISTGKVTMEARHGLVGQAIQLDQAIIVNDYQHYEHRAKLNEHYFEDKPPFQRGICTPLKFASSDIGAVIVGRSAGHPPFDSESIRQLTLFANMVSPSVRNAQLFNELQQAINEAHQANEVKTQFLASVTHELRTPLNLIINNMDFMRTGEFGDVTDEQLRRLNQTVRSAEHLLYLINDLLDVSKIEAGEMQLFIQKQDIYITLEDAIDNAYAYLETYDDKVDQVELRIDVEDNLPEIPMDERRIYQVLNNLLTNAIKFTKQGTVTLKVFQTNVGIHFMVHDTGMGIPQEEMPKLFAAFERTTAARQQAIEGTGLGLPISQYLVQQHGSEITVSSEANHGSTFAFSLPFDTPLTLIPSVSDTQPIMVITELDDKA